MLHHVANARISTEEKNTINQLSSASPLTISYEIHIIFLPVIGYGIQGPPTPLPHFQLREQTQRLSQIYKNKLTHTNTKGNINA